MLNESEKFKKRFLLGFTKKLIKNSSSEPIFELKEEIKQEEEQTKQKVKEVLKREKYTHEIDSPIPFRQQRMPKASVQRKVLRVPEPKLPPNLEYLKPSAKKLELDLGKLNQLTKNPTIKKIECLGEGTKIKANNNPTNITLTKIEIDHIIKKFSEAKKIPVEEGIFTVAAGNLVLTAIVSEDIGSKFIIKKMGFNLFPKKL